MTDTDKQLGRCLPFGPYEGESVDTVAVKDPGYLSDLLREAVGPTDLRADAARALATRGRLVTAVPWLGAVQTLGRRLPRARPVARVVGVGLALVVSALLVGRCVDATTHALVAATTIRGSRQSTGDTPLAVIAPAEIQSRAMPEPWSTPYEGEAQVDFAPEPTGSWTNGSSARDLRETATDAAVESATSDTCGTRLDGAVGAASTHDWVDTHQAVEFRVVRAKDTGRVTFLNSHEPYQGHFYVAIFPSDYDRFADHPVRLFDGRCIVVQGMIELYRGAPQIVLRDPADLRLVGD